MDAGLNVSALWTALITWGLTVTGYPEGRVVQAFVPNAPIPKKPFVTINLQGPARVGSIDDERWGATSGAETKDLLSGLRKFTVSVNVVSDLDAITPALALASSLQLESVIDTLLTAGIGVADVGEIRDLSGMIETKPERRAQFDFTFHAASNIEQTGVSAIEHVNITTPLPE